MLDALLDPGQHRDEGEIPHPLPSLLLVNPIPLRYRMIFELKTQFDFSLPFLLWCRLPHKDRPSLEPFTLGTRRKQNRSKPQTLRPQGLFPKPSRPE